MQFYIAPDGDDAWSGRKPRPVPPGRSVDGPFVTLERARDAIRKLKQDGAFPEDGVRVILGPGDYFRTASFELTAEDGGRPGAPVVYEAAPESRTDRARVRLLGGRLLDKFAPVSAPAVLERFEAEVRDRILECDLKAHGISELGTLRSRGFGRPTVPAHLELFHGGRRMTLARWPNNEYAKISKPAKLDPKGDGHGRELGLLKAGFYYEGNRPHRWQDLDDVWVHGYWAWDWANSYEQIASIDLKKRLIRTRPPHGNYGFNSGQRFYFLNILEELDAPGEYYVDRKSGMLYFWPPEDKLEGETAVSMLDEPFISIEGAEHLTFRGLTFEYARGDGITVSGGEHVTIADCTLRNLGNNGVLINGGDQHKISGCELCKLGDGGVRLRGGDRQTLTPAGHEAVNNHIHHIGEWSRCYQPGVLVSGVGNRVAHNLIHDGPHNAIQLSGNDHIIEFNHIHRVCLDSGDVGAFYVGRDYTMRGIIVRYNFFHDLGGVREDSNAVYLDDCASGVLVCGNIICRCFRGVLIGGGVDNTVENNVLVDCKLGIALDGRGLSQAKIWNDMVYVTMKKSLDARRHHEPPYSDRYPELANLDPYYQTTAGVPPYNSRFCRNIAVNCGEWLRVHWGAEPEMLEECAGNLTEEDPKFRDPANDDYRLEDDSPALKLGFKHIPIDQIGPQRKLNVPAAFPSAPLQTH